MIDINVIHLSFHEVVNYDSDWGIFAVFDGAEIFQMI